MSTPQAHPVEYVRHDRFKIPADHPSALRFYLERLLVPHSRREMILAASARAFGRPRAAFPLFGFKDADRPDERRTAPCAAVRKIWAQLADKGLFDASEPAIITLADYGHSERGKVVAFAFGAADKTPRLVVKMSAAAEHVATLEREHAVLEALSERLDHRLRATLPAPLAVVSEGGQTAFAETFVPGRSIYLEMRNSFFPRRLIERHFTLAVDWLIDFQQATRAGETRLGDSACHQSIVGSLESYQRFLSSSEAERGFIARIIARARQLEDELLPLVACQGDYWPRNVVLQEAQLGVLDWENYTDRGLPFFDLFMFTTSYALNYPWKLGRWASPELAVRSTFSARGWMGTIVRKHLRSYCTRTGVAPALMDVCLPAFIAQRAIETSAPGVPCSHNSQETDARAALEAQSAQSAKEQTWRKMFQEYARISEHACVAS